MQSAQSAQDNVIINRDALTQKEMFLKERLYKNTMPKPAYSHITKELLTQPKTVTIKEDPKAVDYSNRQPKAHFPLPDRPTTSEILHRSFKSEKTLPQESIKHH